MPGEARKFKRRRIVALIPFCKREREDADSHADATAVAAIGVGGEEVTGVVDGDGSAVAVDSGRFVTVGEGTDTLTAVREARGVTVCADRTVGVGESKGACVDATAFVAVGDGSGAVVHVSRRDVDEGGIAVGLAASVDTGVGD